MKKILFILLLISSTAFAQNYRDAYVNGYDYYPTPRTYSGSGDIRDQIIERHQNAMRNQLNREMIRNERAMDFQEIRRLENLRDSRGYDRY